MQESSKLETDKVDKALLDAVRHNCDIADAHSATDFTLCVYLMKMREYYRWREDIPYSTSLKNEAVGRWIRQQEQHWDKIEEDALKAVPFNKTQFDAFETEQINQGLLKRKLVYSAGIGQKGKAHFFLAELEEITERKSFRIIISGNEYARDLISPVAMTLDRTIFLRKQSLQRLIWEKSQELSWNTSETPLARAFKRWDFNKQALSALEKSSEKFMGQIIDHEIGEVMAGEHLGPQWETMLALHLNSKLELQLRAMRDFLADHLSTLPHLFASGEAQAIHFYFGMLSPIRKSMVPTLFDIYKQWLESDDLTVMKKWVEDRVAIWLGACEKLLTIHDEYGKNAYAALQESIEQQLSKINSTLV